MGARSATHEHGPHLPPINHFRDEAKFVPETFASTAVRAGKCREPPTPALWRSDGKHKRDAGAPSVSPSLRLVRPIPPLRPRFGARAPVGPAAPLLVGPCRCLNPLWRAARPERASRLTLGLR